MARLGQSQAAFARQHNVGNHHLHCVLRGDRRSVRLEGLIEEVIARAEALPSEPPPTEPDAQASAA